MAPPTPAELKLSSQRAGAVALLMAAWWLTEALPLHATAMMLFPIGLAIINRLEPESLRASPNAKPGLGATLMLGIAYAASIGGVGTLIGTPPNAIFAGNPQPPKSWDVFFLTTLRQGRRAKAKKTQSP